MATMSSATCSSGRRLAAAVIMSGLYKIWISVPPAEAVTVQRRDYSLERNALKGHKIKVFENVLLVLHGGGIRECKDKNGLNFILCLLQYTCH